MNQRSLCTGTYILQDGQVMVQLLQPGLSGTLTYTQPITVALSTGLPLCAVFGSVGGTSHWIGIEELGPSLSGSGTRAPDKSVFACKGPREA